MRIEAERSVTRALVLDKVEAAAEAMSEARAELLEKAVLANAQGWQSGKVEWKMWQTGWGNVGHILLWMEMTGGPEQVPTD